MEMSFDAEVLATYLAALSELASLKEVILGLPRPGGHFSQVESCGGPVEKVKWGKRPEKARFGPGGPEIIGCIASSWYQCIEGGVFGASELSMEVARNSDL